MHNLAPELCHNFSRQLGLVIHGAHFGRQCARSWAPTAELSNTRPLSTTLRAADEDVIRRCRPSLAEWPEEAAPSDGQQGRGFEPNRCHACDRRAPRGNPPGYTPRGVGKTAWPKGLGVGASFSSEKGVHTGATPKFPQIIACKAFSQDLALRCQDNLAEWLRAVSSSFDSPGRRLEPPTTLAIHVFAEHQPQA